MTAIHVPIAMIIVAQGGKYDVGGFYERYFEVSRAQYAKAVGAGGQSLTSKYIFEWFMKSQDMVLSGLGRRYYALISEQSVERLGSCSQARHLPRSRQRCFTERRARLVKCTRYYGAQTES
jgi:hypothetical protein